MVALRVLPTVLLIGLVAGLVVGPRSHFSPLAIVGAVASIGWGLLVADSGAFVGGVLLAVPNFAVGAAAGIGVRSLVTAAAKSGHNSRTA